MNVVKRLAKLNWIAIVLTPLLVILMEAFWVYPWLVLVGKWPALVWLRPPLGLASVILLLSIAYFATRFLLGGKRSLTWIRMGVILCGLITIFLVMRIEYSAGFGLLSGAWFVATGRILLNSFSQAHPLVVALPVGAYLWWRGISLGRMHLYSDDIYRSFLVGIGSLVVLILFWWVSLRTDALEALAATVAPYVVAFFFCGLASLALSNLGTVQQRMLPEDVTGMFIRRWLPVLFGIVGGIVLIAIGIASIFSPEFVAFLATLFGSLLAIMRQAVYYILWPFGYLAVALVYAGIFLVNLLRGGRPVELPEVQEFVRPEDITEAGAVKAIPEVAIVVLKWALFAIIGTVIILLVARAIRRYQSLKAETEVDEIDESLWSWEGFKADVGLFFSLLLGRLRRKIKQATSRVALPGRRTAEEVEGTLGIRELYRRLLREASSLGVVHRSYETPYEYALRLHRALPDDMAQIGQLTELYVGVRYGDVPADARQVEYANNLWRLIKNLFSRTRSTQDAE